MLPLETLSHGLWVIAVDPAFIAWHFSKFKSGFSRVYSNSYCSCLCEPEIMKIGQSSYKMYSNNILNFQESTTILNAHTKSPETY